VLEAPVSGEIRLAIPGTRSVRRRVPELEKSLDYVGLNYYTRWMVRATGPEPHVARRGAAVTDLGWEIYPRGLEEAVIRVASTGAPVIVTEHGFADAADALRPRALVESLLHLERAIERGARVIGYLHWSLIDNFEWADGFGPRFGLYGVDFSRPERPRERRRSAEIFSRIARAGAIGQDVTAEVGLAL